MKEVCRDPAGETDVAAETNSPCGRVWRGPHLEGGGRLVAIPRVHQARRHVAVLAGHPAQAGALLQPSRSATYDIVNHCSGCKLVEESRVWQAHHKSAEPVSKHTLSETF